MSKINEYVKNITPALYEQLKTAVETGKWLDGAPLTEEQKEHTLQLIIAYQNAFNDEPEHFTISQSGEIHMEPKKKLKQQFSEKDDADDIHVLKI